LFPFNNMYNIALADIFNNKYCIKMFRTFSLVPSYFFKVLNQYYYSTQYCLCLPSARYCTSLYFFDSASSSTLLLRFFYRACISCFTFLLLPPLSPPFSGTSLPTATSCLSCGPVLCTHSSACCTPKIY
jgi:hypothetical protein